MVCWEDAIHSPVFFWVSCKNKKNLGQRQEVLLSYKTNGTLNAMAQEREQKFLMEASAMARWQAGSAALPQWSQRSRTPGEIKCVCEGTGFKERWRHHLVKRNGLPGVWTFWILDAITHRLEQKRVKAPSLRLSSTMSDKRHWRVHVEHGCKVLVS